MKKTIMVGLTGHDAQYRLDEDAYERLSGYLDRAASRLDGDADRAEVLDDLERSIGDRLTAAATSPDQVFDAAALDAILDEIGAVDTGRDPEPEAAGGTDHQPRRRRLQRIKQGQQLAGVCNGIADYAELDVAWVRTGFVLGSLVTGGILVLVYIALALILPVAPRSASRS